MRSAFGKTMLPKWSLDQQAYNSAQSGENKLAIPIEFLGAKFNLNYRVPAS